MCSSTFRYLLWPQIEGISIIFCRCNLFIFYFVSIDERPAMISQPNLASRSKVVSIYKCLQKFRGPPQTWGSKTKFWLLFSRLQHSTPDISEMKRRIDKQKMIIQPTMCPLKDDLLYVTFDRETAEIGLLIIWPNIRRPLGCNHKSCDISS